MTPHPIGRVYPRELAIVPEIADDTRNAWVELAHFAAHALKPGGFLVAKSGQVALQEVYDRMRWRARQNGVRG